MLISALFTGAIILVCGKKWKMILVFSYSQEARLHFDKKIHASKITKQSGNNDVITLI